MALERHHPLPRPCSSPYPPIRTADLDWPALLANVVVLAILVVGARANRGRGRNDETATVLAAWWAYGWPMSLWLGLAPLLLYSDRLLLRPLGRRRNAWRILRHHLT